MNLNNKLIGIHKEGIEKKNNFNRGTFLNEPIKEFIKLNYNNKGFKIIRMVKLIKKYMKKKFLIKFLKLKIKQKNRILEMINCWKIKNQ